MKKSRTVLLAIGVWLWIGCGQESQIATEKTAKSPTVFLWEKDSAEAQKLLYRMSKPYLEMPDSLRPKDSLLNRRNKWAFYNPDTLSLDSNEASLSFPDSIPAPE